MMQRHVHNWVVCVAATLALTSATFGQTANPFPPDINTEQNPLRNVRASATRAPGNMVNAGVARTVLAANAARGIIQITEPPPGPDPKAVFLSEAVEIIFDQINQAILLFENLLRARAGLPPRVPIDLPTDGDTTDGDTTDDTTDNIDSEDVQGILDQLE